jgi:hypothetical protein
MEIPEDRDRGRSWRETWISFSNLQQSVQTVHDEDADRSQDEVGRHRHYDYVFPAIITPARSISIFTAQVKFPKGSGVLRYLKPLSRSSLPQIYKIVSSTPWTL